MSASPDHRLPPVFIQARMSSRRLPGKVLMDLAGQPVLGRLLGRLALSRSPLEIAVLTSDHPNDDPIARFCAQHGARCHRGPLDDVALRFLGAAHALKARACVRLSADSPLFDARVLDRLMDLHQRQPLALTTNVHPRSFPKGQSAEIFPVELLAAHHPNFSPEDREHVTRYFYNNAGSWKIANLRHEPSAAQLSLALDTPEDRQRLEELLRSRQGAEKLSWQALLDLPAGSEAA